VEQFIHFDIQKNAIFNFSGIKYFISIGNIKGLDSKWGADYSKFKINLRSAYFEIEEDLKIKCRK
jgi:hypothetical protein